MNPIHQNNSFRYGCWRRNEHRLPIIGKALMLIAILGLLLCAFTLESYLLLLGMPLLGLGAYLNWKKVERELPLPPQIPRSTTPIRPSRMRQRMRYHPYMN